MQVLWSMSRHKNTHLCVSDKCVTQYREMIDRISCLIILLRRNFTVVNYYLLLGSNYIKRINDNKIGFLYQ